MERHSERQSPFLPTAAPVQVIATPIDDSEYENFESIYFQIVEPVGYTIGTPSAASVTLISDDPKPVITITRSPASVLEDGGTPIVFTFNRTVSTAQR